MTKDPNQIAKRVVDHATEEPNTMPYTIVNMLTENSQVSYTVVKIINDDWEWDIIARCDDAAAAGNLVVLLHRQWREQNCSWGRLVGLDDHDNNCNGYDRRSGLKERRKNRPHTQREEDTAGSSNGDTMQELYALSEANCKSASSKYDPAEYAFLAGQAMGHLSRIKEMAEKSYADVVKHYDWILQQEKNR